MSIGGPSALGTLLVHRLDSVLGTTLSQQANLVTGARPDAVSQPGSADRPDAAQNETHRQTRDGVDRATAQTGQQTKDAANQARIDARAAEILAARSAPATSTTQSAPTSLGHAARTILALLANFPDQAAAVQGKTPLLTANPRAASRGNAGNAAAASGSNPGNAATASNNAARADALAGLNRTSGAALPTTGALSGAAAATAAGQAANALPAQLAQALAHALQRSGMFYESHLHNLAFGKQTLAQLEQEPQAQTGRGAPDGSAPGGKNTATAGSAQQPANTASQAGANNNTTSTAATHAQRGDGATGSQNIPTPASANTSVPVPGLDPQTHQLVRQQLEVLANQTFSWRGEAWPNAPMEWEVNRREPSWEDTDLPPETDQWATRINIHLPVLGNVQARLTLAGQQLVMHLIAPESSGLLKEHTETLRERYSAMGMQLSQLSVSRNAWEAAGSGQQVPDNPTAAYYQQHDSADAAHNQAPDA